MKSPIAAATIDDNPFVTGGQWVMQAFDAWHSIPLRRWIWTTVIAFILFTANTLGYITAVLSSTDIRPNVTRMIIALVGAYFFLLALTVAEIKAPHRRKPLQPYFVAAVAAIAVATAFDTTVSALTGNLVGRNRGMGLVISLVHHLTWEAASWALTGGLAVAVYYRFQEARSARESFHRAELERVAASREVLASRLAAMQAQVEPQFLLGTLAHVEALCERDAIAGSRMLDALIAYLRAALPQLRSEGSTLGNEAQLVNSYLSVIELRTGSRLDFVIDVPSTLAECVFPPMVLLPLIDDVLRNALEPLSTGARIRLRAHAKAARLHVGIDCDGLIAPANPIDERCHSALQERLDELYGERARMTFKADSGRSRIEIELPYETAGDNR